VIFFIKKDKFILIQTGVERKVTYKFIIFLCTTSFVFHTNSCLVYWCYCWVFIEQYREEDKTKLDIEFVW